MFFKWVKANLINYMMQNKGSLKNWAIALYGGYVLIIGSALIADYWSITNRWGEVIYNDDWINIASYKLMDISGRLMVITVILPIFIYMIYRLYKSFQKAKQNYVNFTKNGGKIIKEDHSNLYDPYRRP